MLRWTSEKTVRLLSPFSLLHPMIEKKKVQGSLAVSQRGESVW